MKVRTQIKCKCGMFILLINPDQIIDTNGQEILVFQCSECGQFYTKKSPAPIEITSEMITEVK